MVLHEKAAGPRVDKRRERNAIEIVCGDEDETDTGLNALLPRAHEKSVKTDEDLSARLYIARGNFIEASDQRGNRCPERLFSWCLEGTRARPEGIYIPSKEGSMETSLDQAVFHERSVRR